MDADTYRAILNRILSEDQDHSKSMCIHIPRCAALDDYIDKTDIILLMEVNDEIKTLY